MIRIGCPLAHIYHQFVIGPPADYVTTLITFYVLIYHFSAEWTTSWELITATHHPCSTAAQKNNILQRNDMINTSSRNIAKQLQVPVMCDRPVIVHSSVCARVCVHNAVCLFKMSCKYNRTVSNCVCFTFRVHCSMEWALLLPLGYWVSHHKTFPFYFALDIKYLNADIYLDLNWVPWHIGLLTELTE